MKIALTVWGNRISPVFDSAKTLLISQINNDKIINQFCDFQPCDPNFLDLLRDMNVSVLITGAISEVAEKKIESSNIKLIPFVTGNAHHLLDLLLRNKPVPSANFMPGYKRDRNRDGLDNFG